MILFMAMPKWALAKLGVRGMGFVEQILYNIASSRVHCKSQRSYKHELGSMPPLQHCCASSDIADSSSLNHACPSFSPPLQQNPALTLSQPAIPHQTLSCRIQALLKSHSGTVASLDDAACSTACSTLCQITLHLTMNIDIV